MLCSFVRPVKRTNQLQIKFVEMNSKPDPEITKKQDEPLQEGRDFILERGFMVLTSEYLLQRGYCCGNGCRNCPYNKMGQVRIEVPK